LLPAREKFNPKSGNKRKQKDEGNLAPKTRQGITYKDVFSPPRNRPVVDHGAITEVSQLHHSKEACNN